MAANTMNAYITLSNKEKSGFLLVPHLVKTKAKSLKFLEPYMG